MKLWKIFAAACVGGTLLYLPLSGQAASRPASPINQPLSAQARAAQKDGSSLTDASDRRESGYLAAVRGGGLPCLRHVNLGGTLEEIKTRNAEYTDPSRELPETLTVEGDIEFNAKVSISTDSGAELREYELHQDWIEKMTYTLTLDGGMLPGFDEAYARHFKRLCQEVKNGGYGQPYLDQTPYRCEWKSKAGAQVVLRYYTPKRDPECKYPCLVLTLTSP